MITVAGFVVLMTTIFNEWLVREWPNVPRISAAERELKLLEGTVLFLLGYMAVYLAAVYEFITERSFRFRTKILDNLDGIASSLQRLTFKQ